LLPYYELDLGFDVHVHPDSSHGGGDCLRCRRVNFVGGEGLLIDQACREHPNPSRIFELPTHVVAPEPVAHAIVNADRRATILSALRFA
jgi:hypothetical protein